MKGHGLCKMGLVLLALALVVGLSGCEMLEEELLTLVATEWLNENRATAVRQTVTGSTGNPQADAALEPWEVLEEINEADQLMEAGRRDRDPKLMEQAMEKRPGDWTYRMAYGALLLEQGDTLGAESQLGFVNSAVLVAPQRVPPREALRYANAGIAELEAVEARLANRPMSGMQCKVLFEHLAHYYDVRGTVTGSTDDARLAGLYAEDAKRCRQ